MFNKAMRLLSRAATKSAPAELLPTAAEKISIATLPIFPPLPLPTGVSEQELFNFVTSVRVADAPEDEMRRYGTLDFKRFVYTFGLINRRDCDCLELGANPYFTTMLIDRYADVRLTLANYFGLSPKEKQSQVVAYQEDGKEKTKTFSYHAFNLETETFPYADESFDFVIFAEIIEHLLTDPCKVLREIHRVLRPGGQLILTTPNATRLENVAKFIAGVNIYDPYSGYGPYGRHNREYIRHELVQLLTHEGFSPDLHFTADVSNNDAAHFVDIAKLLELVQFRQYDLGQYLFVRAAKADRHTELLPSWLYRSYDASKLL